MKRRHHPFPAGTFTTGESGKLATVATLGMNRTEVTVAAVEASEKAGKCTPADRAGRATPSRRAGRCTSSTASTGTSRSAYCKAQGQRLPPRFSRHRMGAR